jgi:nitrate reductase gamma subunit
MGHSETSSLLHTAEVVHWAALCVMGLVYTIRLYWIFRFKAGRDRQLPGERGTTSISPALYSLGNVAMPWAMESTRNGMLFYTSFVVFHLGVVAGIAGAFVSSLYRPFLENRAVCTLFMVVIGAAFLISVIRMLRRLTRPHLRLISSPDDYFSLLTLTVWFALGVPAMGYIGGFLENEGWLTAYLFATSFFLIYVPFSKISHYLYYPFTRYFIGKTLGHRGSMPAVRG